MIKNSKDGTVKKFFPVYSANRLQVRGEFSI
jgi:hypothetical protein